LIGLTQEQNKYLLRRATALAATITRLGMEKASFIGHSKGAHIAAQVATRASIDLEVPGLVLVNGVGIGETGNMKGQFISNTRSNELFDPKNEYFGLLLEAIPSAASSFVYGVTHVRRWLKEKKDIQTTYPETWDMIDEAVESGTTVTVMHAVDDRALEINGARLQAAHRPKVNFIETAGGHSNIYTPEVTKQIVNAIVQD